MIDSERILERLERVTHDMPFCPCGAPAVLVGREDGVWLTCATLRSDRGFAWRLLHLDPALGHMQQRVVELSVDAPELVGSH